MTLPIQELGNDADYIAKHNANYAAIKQAIEGLQAAAGGAGGSVNVSSALRALFPASSNAVIGVGSYATTVNGATLDVAAGFAWLNTGTRVTENPSSVNLDPAGQSSGTLYVAPDGSGVPIISDDDTDALYSFSWNGSAISNLTRTAAISWGGAEWVAAQASAARSTSYNSPDARLEAIETAQLAIEQWQANTTDVQVENAATGTVTLDARIRHAHITLVGNVTLAFSNPPPADTAARLSLVIQQDATGGRTVTWPASVVWPGGSPPTITAAADAIDQVELVTVDEGTNWLARAWQNFG